MEQQNGGWAPEKRDLTGFFKGHPLGLVTAGFAVGLLAGLSFPATSFENERLGEASDRAKDQLQANAQDLIEQGKEAAQEVVASALKAPSES